MNTYNMPFAGAGDSVASAIEGLIEPLSVERQLNDKLVIRGRLLVPAERIFPSLRTRFEQIGYTPFLEEHHDGVLLTAIPGVIERRPQRWRLNLVLFVLTAISVLYVGGTSAISEQLLAASVPASQIGDRVAATIAANPLSLLSGWPFAATLLGILLAHEMGHYIVSRIRGAPASLPFFIPLPFTFTGTMGAVIVQREPFENRRTLLEVAIAGPLAGLVVAIPLLFFGLWQSRLGPPPSEFGYVQEGNSLLYALAKYAVYQQWLPAGGQDVQLSAVAWGAWIGLLVTMLNLLPVGQLDGGHVAYALLGKYAEYLSYVTLVVFLGLGLLGTLGLGGSSSWLVWVILIGLMGPRHPKPFNDVVRLKPVHVALGVIGLITFVLLFMPTPLVLVPPIG